MNKNVKKSELIKSQQVGMQCVCVRECVSAHLYIKYSPFIGTVKMKRSSGSNIWRNDKKKIEKTSD